MAKPNLHIITGGSKGLGAGLAHYLAGRGDQTVSLARTVGSFESRVKEYQVDLGGDFSSAETLAKIFSEFSLENFDHVTLTNNAGLIDPVAQVEKLIDADIANSLAINLYAPIALTAEFLRQTRGHRGVRTVVNVSSGVARRPKACWSVYSAAKAGLEAFSLALESEHLGVRIVTFNPGVMDTAMQQRIRSVSDLDFPDRARFVGLKNEGQLRSKDVVGEALGKVLLGEALPNQSHITIDEVLAGGF